MRKRKEAGRNSGLVSSDSLGSINAFEDMNKPMGRRS